MKSVALSLALSLLLFASGCRHVATLTPSQSFQLTADQSLSVIAHLAQAAEKSAQQLNVTMVTKSDGTSHPLLDTATTRDVLNWAETASKADQSALSITKSGQTPQQIATSVLATLQQIPQLPASITALTTGTQRAEVTALVGMLQDIVTSVQAVISAAQKGVTP
jgi:hypothetical protein